MATVITSDDTSGSTAIARWARLSSLGLRLAAAAPLLMLVAGLLWGLDVGEDLPFFVVTAALAIGGSFLVRRRRAAARVAGIVLGVLCAVALFWTMFGLGAPASFFDFVPGVLVVPGVLTAVVAGIGAIRAERRGDAVGAPTGGERRAMTVALGLVGVLAVVSAIATIAGRETVDDDADVDLEVEMADFEFDATTYGLAPGVTVLVRNTDPFLHTFTVDDLGIDVDLGPGSEKLVTIPEDAEPGSYVVYCEPHTGSPEEPSEDDMAARLEVS